jgi:hypothetical protein
VRSDPEGAVTEADVGAIVRHPDRAAVCGRWGKIALPTHVRGFGGTLCCTVRVRPASPAALVSSEVEDPMFTRRELLTRGTTVLLLIPVIGCSSSSDGAGSCAGIESTSTNNASHTHTLCVPTSDLTGPPAAGKTYTTSNVGNHTHMVTLSAANLTALIGGQTVTVTSTSDPDPINNEVHSHDFMIKKM